MISPLVIRIDGSRMDSRLKWLASSFDRFPDFIKGEITRFFGDDFDDSRIFVNREDVPTTETGDKSFFDCFSVGILGLDELCSAASRTVDFDLLLPPATILDLKSLTSKLTGAGGMNQKNDAALNPVSGRTHC